MKILVFVVMCVVLVACSPVPKIIDGCGEFGNAKPNDKKERQLYQLKNRYTAPTPEQTKGIELDSILERGNDSTRWSNDSGAIIEGVLIDTMKGGDESCNCYNTMLHDTHLYIGKKKGVHKESCMVCEVTPRWRSLLKPTLDSLRIGDSVRITGWMMWDTRHIAESRNTRENGDVVERKTAWEIHPITNIENLKH